MKRIAATLAIGILLPGHGWAQTPAGAAAAVIEAASAAMHAGDLATLEFTGTGTMFTHGQALARFGPLPRFDVTSFDYRADYQAPGSRVERVRVQGANPPRGGGPQPVVGQDRSVTYLKGEDAWTVNAAGAATRQPGGQGLDADIVEQRQIELWETPHGFLAAARKSASATVTTRQVGGTRFRVVSVPRGKTHLDGYIDDQNRVAKVETWVAHPTLGDMSIEATYGEYRDWDGLQFPAHLTERWGGETVLDLTITGAKRNPPVDLTVPEKVRATPLPPLTTIVTTKIGDGIYDIAGQNAATIAIEFKDYVMAVEAGTHQERSLAVIDEIKRIFPAKPIRYLINTHAQYLDHAGGVRPYAAIGATIVTYKDNRKWFEEVAFRGTWTIKPDALSMMKTTPRVEIADERKVMTDGSREVVLYHVQGNSHDASMLMVYLPAEKWLIEADLYSTLDDGTPMFGPPAPPPGAAADFPRCCDARNFYDNVQRLKLDVATIVPIHGAPASWNSFVAFLGKTPAR